MQSCLGMGFDPVAGQITFDEPRLPDFLDEVVLHRLAVGDAHVDVSLRRSGSQVLVDVLRRTGTVKVLTTK
jgi:hypothetical protein